MKYSIIYADCPWSFNNKNTGGSMKSGSEAQYKTMSVDEICNLPISEIVADDCILFMWWVGSQPEEALNVVKSWGFKVKTMSGFNWIKLSKNCKLEFNMGFYTRQLSESCLIATKGKPKVINHGIRSVQLVEEEYNEETIFALNEKHSKKPDIFRERIVELMGDLPRVELFARQETEGWDVFGNEVKNSIEL